MGLHGSFLVWAGAAARVAARDQTGGLARAKGTHHRAHCRTGITCRLRLVVTPEWLAYEGWLPYKAGCHTRVVVIPEWLAYQSGCHTRVVGIVGIRTVSHRPARIGIACHCDGRCQVRMHIRERASHAQGLRSQIWQLAQYGSFPEMAERRARGGGGA